jgi:hypothetical protein
MTREKDGQDHAQAANDNQPFDEKKWRKDYMREYMRKKRERLRLAKLKSQAEAKIAAS